MRRPLRKRERAAMLVSSMGGVLVLSSNYWGSVGNLVLIVGLFVMIGGGVVLTLLRERP